MRTGLAFIGLALVLGLAACAGTPDGPPQPGHMRLTAMEVGGDPKTNIRYPVSLRYEVNGDAQIIYTCFTWMDDTGSFAWLDDWTGLGDGPYCLAPDSVVAPGIVTTKLASGYAGRYELRAYVQYRSGGVLQSTNMVASPISVTRRYP
jgi:hypothetical protein